MVQNSHGDQHCKSQVNQYIVFIKSTDLVQSYPRSESHETNCECNSDPDDAYQEALRDVRRSSHVDVDVQTSLDLKWVGIMKGFRAASCC